MSIMQQFLTFGEIALIDSAYFKSAGMPVPVARKLLQDSNRLVAKAVTSADEAAAAAAGGVNVLFLQVGTFCKS